MSVLVAVAGRLCAGVRALVRLRPHIALEHEVGVCMSASLCVGMGVWMCMRSRASTIRTFLLFIYLFIYFSATGGSCWLVACGALGVIGSVHTGPYYNKCRSPIKSSELHPNYTWIKIHTPLEKKNLLLKTSKI